MATVKVTIDKGPKGDTGPQGEQGPQGPQGNVGPQGSIGPQGDTGADGAPGADGLDGQDGSNGQDGADGQDGSNGQGVAAGGTAGQALVKVDGSDYNTQWADIAVDTQYHDRFATDAETLRSGATDTVELYYTAKADGDGLAEDAESDTPTAGKVIKRKIYYSEAAFADPDTGTWVEFTTLADDITFANAKAALLEYLKARTGGTVPISLKQTWEEVTAAPAFTGLLNETYGSGAEAAYSTRRLNGNVTDCMVIRRASGTPATTTIGFDSNGDIDEAAIETFCTGTTCTVETWKDQSGNGNDATAPSTGAEPTIYTGGEIVKENGKPAVKFINSALSITSNLFSGTTPRAFFITGYTVNTPSADEMIFAHTSTVGGSGTGYGITSEIALRVGTYAQWDDDFQGTSIQLLTNTWDSGDAFDAGMYLDGTTLSTSGGNNTAALNTEVSNLFYLGTTSYNPTYFTEMVLSEFIIYASSKSAVRTDIEQNVGDYFTQNTPLLDTYSGAAAAYSLRLLDSTYTGSAIRVRRASNNDEQDIGFNVFGELDTVALAAFCGSSDGFVRTWFDQSGSGNHAEQDPTSGGSTANQPKIYDGTTGVVTENGKPAVEFDGDNMTNTNSRTITTQTSFFAGLYSQSGGGTRILTISNSTDYQKLVALQHSGSGNIVTLYKNNEYGALSPDKNTQILLTHHNTGSQITNYKNGTAGTTSTVSVTQAVDGDGIGNRHQEKAYGRYHEVIIYDSSQSASNRTGIEANMNTFYSIYS